MNYADGMMPMPVCSPEVCSNVDGDVYPIKTDVKEWSEAILKQAKEDYRYLNLRKYIRENGLDIL